MYGAWPWLDTQMTLQMLNKDGQTSGQKNSMIIEDILRNPIKSKVTN